MQRHVVAYHIIETISRQIGIAGSHAGQENVQEMPPVGGHRCIGRDRDRHHRDVRSKQCSSKFRVLRWFGRLVEHDIEAHRRGTVPRQDVDQISKEATVDG